MSGGSSLSAYDASLMSQFAVYIPVYQIPVPNNNYAPREPWWPSPGTFATVDPTVAIGQVGMLAEPISTLDLSGEQWGRGGCDQRDGDPQRRDAQRGGGDLGGGGRGGQRRW